MAFKLLAFGNTLKLVSKLRADLLSSQKLLAAKRLQKQSIMQVLATNILMTLSIVRIVCECFLPRQESRPKIPEKKHT